MARLAEVPLDFTNLAEIDNGRVNRLFRLHLQRIAQDLIGRPGDKAKRKVSLEFIIVPVCSPEGECEGCKVEIEAKSKVPLYRTKAYEMNVTTTGLSFNRDFPDAKDQLSLLPESDEDDEEEEGQ